MSKLTPLQALENIKRYYPFDIRDLEYQNIDIIESALKEYENQKAIDKFMERTCKDLGVHNPTEELVLAAKQLKALDIIKNRQVDVGLLLACESEPEYLNRCCNRYWTNDKCGWKRLTQEEYDLLKEVLTDVRHD